jgi:hypothetical protein
MTPLVIRMMIVSDATPWSITYNHHSDERNIFITQATHQSLKFLNKVNWPTIKYTRCQDSQLCDTRHNDTTIQYT